MAKVWAILAVLAAVLFAAPVIESSTTGTTQVFQAVGTADGGS